MHKKIITINKTYNEKSGSSLHTSSLTTPLFFKKRLIATYANKLLKLSALPILLSLSTPSIAALNIEQSNTSIPTADSSDQCGYYHRQVINYHMITAKAAVTHNPEKIAEIKLVQDAAEQYIMSADVSTFLSEEELYSYYNDEGEEKVREVLQRNNGLTQNNARDVLLYLFNTHYFGEYVPKNDHKAVRYLSKYIELIQQITPEQVEAHVIGTIYKMGDYGEMIEHQNNPTWSNDIEESPFKMLIEAGLIDAEAMLLADDFDTNDPKCIEYSLPKLIVLANEGSRLAIHLLADEADDLIERVPELFDVEDKHYWQQKAESLPIEGIDWRP